MMTLSQCLEASGTAIIAIAIAVVVATIIVTSAVTFWLARRSPPQAKGHRTVDAELRASDALGPPSQCGASPGLDIWALRPRTWNNDQTLVFTVQQWADERVLRIPGAELRAMLAFQDFCQWCGEQGHTPPAVAAFGRAFTVVVESWGSRKVKKRCATYYQGCRLSSGQG